MGRRSTSSSTGRTVTRTRRARASPASPSWPSTAGARRSPRSTSAFPCDGSAGRPSGRSTCSRRSAASESCAGADGFDLLRLGPGAARHRTRLAELPSAAHRDSGAILARIVPDLPSSAVGRAAAALVDGRPAAPADLGEAWDAVERSVLSEPTFAASYLALRERAGGAAALRWLALAPERPGAPERHRAWFLVALPGNLVALELVSEGAHATYCFRAAPRAGFTGGSDPAGIDAVAAARTVAMVSNALVDARFLREPIALPDDQLATPKGIRYRLALRALPVAGGRARRVRRPPGPPRRGELVRGPRRPRRLARRLSGRDRHVARPDGAGSRGLRRHGRRGRLGMTRRSTDPAVSS